MNRERYMSNKKGEWQLIAGENFKSIQPIYRCSVCKYLISTYYPPDKCEGCGATNKFKGNSVSVRIEMCKAEDLEVLRYIDSSRKREKNEK